MECMGWGKVCMQCLQVTANSSRLEVEGGHAYNYFNSSRQVSSGETWYNTDAFKVF